MIDICNTCRSMIKDIKSSKAVEGCKKYGPNKSTCEEIYYYLQYFEPEYLNDKDNTDETNCEICSNMDQCYNYQCMGGKDETEDKDKDLENIIKKDQSEGVSNVMNEREKLEKEEIIHKTKQGVNNNKKNSGNNVEGIKSINKLIEKVDNTKRSSNDSVRSSSTQKQDSFNKMALGSRFKAQSSITFEKKKEVFQKQGSNSVNFDLREGVSAHTPIDKTVQSLQTRMTTMKSNIEIFKKINSQTSQFKQNVIKFFLYLKQKKQRDPKIIDSEVSREKLNIKQLWQSSKDITEMGKKLERLIGVLKKGSKIKEGKIRNKELSKLIIDIHYLFRQLDKLLVKIQLENQHKINYFHNSMFNTEMRRVYPNHPMVVNHIIPHTIYHGNMSNTRNHNYGGHNNMSNNHSYSHNYNSNENGHNNNNHDSYKKPIIKDSINNHNNYNVPVIKVNKPVDPPADDNDNNNNNNDNNNNSENKDDDDKKRSKKQIIIDNFTKEKKEETNSNNNNNSSDRDSDLDQALTPKNNDGMDLKNNKISDFGHYKVLQSKTAKGELRKNTENNNHNNNNSQNKKNNHNTNNRVSYNNQSMNQNMNNNNNGNQFSNDNDHNRDENLIDHNIDQISGQIQPNMQSNNNNNGMILNRIDNSQQQGQSPFASQVRNPPRFYNLRSKNLRVNHRINDRNQDQIAQVEMKLPNLNQANEQVWGQNMKVPQGAIQQKVNKQVWGQNTKVPPVDYDINMLNSQVNQMDDEVDYNNKFNTDPNSMSDEMYHSLGSQASNSQFTNNYNSNNDIPDSLTGAVKSKKNLFQISHQELPINTDNSIKIPENIKLEDQSGISNILNGFSNSDKLKKLLELIKTPLYVPDYPEESVKELFDPNTKKNRGLNVPDDIRLNAKTELASTLNKFMNSEKLKHLVDMINTPLDGEYNQDQLKKKAEEEMEKKAELKKIEEREKKAEESIKAKLEARKAEEEKIKKKEEMKKREELKKKAEEDKRVAAEVEHQKKLDNEALQKAENKLEELRKEKILIEEDARIKEIAKKKAAKAEEIAKKKAADALKQVAQIAEEAKKIAEKKIEKKKQTKEKKKQDNATIKEAKEELEKLASLDKNEKVEIKKGNLKKESVNAKKDDKKEDKKTEKTDKNNKNKENEVSNDALKKAESKLLEQIKQAQKFERDRTQKTKPKQTDVNSQGNQNFITKSTPTTNNMATPVKHIYSSHKRKSKRAFLMKSEKDRKNYEYEHQLEKIHKEQVAKRKKKDYKIGVNKKTHEKIISLQEPLLGLENNDVDLDD